MSDRFGGGEDEGERKKKTVEMKRKEFLRFFGIKIHYILSLLLFGDKGSVENPQPI